MNYFQRRNLRKAVRHLLHDARHARHMRSDIASAEDLRALEEAESQLRDLAGSYDEAVIQTAADHLAECVEKIHPQRSFAKLRENIEILAVAVTVALAVRTYFVQPFKIPTGSMQPTLYGITVQPQAEKGMMDYLPLSLVKMVLFGEKYVEVRAKVSGELSDHYDVREDKVVVYIDGVPHEIRREMANNMRLPSGVVEKGSVLAAGTVRLGDHVFVNKVRYNFSRPQRGDIFVFSTERIDYPQIRPDSFYIKRLVGLPGDEIAVDPPYLVVNGRKITEPYPFHRLLTERDKGYIGYQLARPTASQVLISNRQDRILLTDNQYLPFGDNTAFSLDGRYFGGVERQSIVGPAFAVYWPFSKRWGRVQ